MTFTEEEIVRMNAIMRNRAEAYLGVKKFPSDTSIERHKRAKEAKAEATTSDDYDFMNGISRKLSKEINLYAELRTEMWKDFGKDRCSVCGHTTKQAEAINYDCTLEC